MWSDLSPLPVCQASKFNWQLVKLLRQTGGLGQRWRDWLIILFVLLLEHIVSFAVPPR